MFISRRRWSDSDINTLKRLASTTPPKFIAWQLNRSSDAIRHKASRLGIYFIVARKGGDHA